MYCFQLTLQVPDRLFGLQSILPPARQVQRSAPMEGISIPVHHGHGPWGLAPSS